jgi:transmembrane sensor
MKTVVEFPEKGVLAEEAAEWLIRLDADTPPSSQELRALGEWLHRSPAHREELEKLAALWGRMNVLTELAVPLGKSVEAVGPYRQTSWLRHGVAAAAVGAVFAAGLVYLLRGSAENEPLTAKALYATAVGQQTTTELPDGSQIILNTNSQIRVDYSDRYRKVYLLQGEALFTVAESAARPFRVYAGTGRIQALGTAFSVYLDGADVEVMVTEGRVALASIEPTRTATTNGSRRSAR